ncbi:MAG: NUDIX domain-containing protein [Cetobacterium sp.]|uniref:NUDIX domain-containing protein n=1 Tax=Cetobacterium sp. TaxID=2071632 RepID=UPI003F36D472
MGFLKIEVLDNGREVLKMKNSVVATVVTSDHKILVATQSRAGSLTDLGIVHKSMGCIAGYVEYDEYYDEALFRELEEESNIDHTYISHIIDLTESSPKASSEGYSTEKSRMYVCISSHSSEELSKIMKCNDEDEDIELSFIDPDLDKLHNISGLKAYYTIQQAMNIIEFIKGNICVIPVKITEMLDNGDNIQTENNIQLRANSYIGMTTFVVNVRRLEDGMLQVTTDHRKKPIICRTIRDALDSVEMKKYALRYLRQKLELVLHK